MGRAGPVAFIALRAVLPRMADILAENLSGKAVMGSDGTELGMLYNITMDLKTGELHDLLVSPNEDTPRGKVNFERDEGGRFRVPVSRVQAVKDYIVVQR
jgi:sporulation protein YlmC with PRC-barrel domain